MGLPWMASLWRDAPPAVEQSVTEIIKTRNWLNPLALPHKGWEFRSASNLLCDIHPTHWIV
jgi:uncharacterized protein with von Willebrand factor type A (vWA) domain